METITQCDAAEIGLRAERRAGEMLKESKEKGDRASKIDNLKHVSKSQTATSIKPVTLEEIGINKSQSSRWQAIASIPEEEFEHAARIITPRGEGMARKSGSSGAATTITSARRRNGVYTH